MDAGDLEDEKEEIKDEQRMGEILRWFKQECTMYSFSLSIHKVERNNFLILSSNQLM